MLATLDYLHHRWSPLILVPFLLSAAAASDIDSSATQKDSALVISASGQVSTNKNGQDWAIGQAERIGITKPIITGQDGYARFAVAGGTDFEVFANSLVTFRENVGIHRISWISRRAVFAFNSTSRPISRPNIVSSPP